MFGRFLWKRQHNTFSHSETGSPASGIHCDCESKPTSTARTCRRQTPVFDIQKKTFAENVSVVHVLNLCRSKLISSHFHGLTIQACLLSCFSFCIVAAFDVERRTLLSRRGLNGPAASSPRHYSQQSPGSDGTCPCSYHYGGMLLLRNTSCSFCLGLFSTFPEWFSQNNRSYSSLFEEPIVFDAWYVQGEPFRSFFTWMVEFSLKTFQQFSCENQLLPLHSLWIWTWRNVLLCRTDFFFSFLLLHSVAQVSYFAKNNN